MLERDIVKEVLEYLRGRGYFAEKLHGGPAQRTGMPDVLACVNGRFVGIEVKVPGKGASPIQEQVMAEIIAAGGVAFEAHSVAEVKRGLKAGGIYGTTRAAKAS